MDEKRIDDLVAMIDQFMSNNGGHMNVTAEDNGNLQMDTASVKISTMNSLDRLAAEPGLPGSLILFEGMDRLEDDPEYTVFPANGKKNG